MAESSWQGRLGVCYSRYQGQTCQRLTEVQAPFKLQRPFYPEGKHRCHGVVLHTAGGLVGGDRLDLHAILEPGAEALLTTVAATKIYGPGRLTQGLGPIGLEAGGRRGGAAGSGPIAPSCQQIRWQLGAGCHGEWLPLETIAYGGARHCQTVRVELGEGATWLGWEMLRLGRSAGGETFAGGEWRSRTEVWQQGRPLWIDPQWIPGEPEVLDGAQGLAGLPVVGTLAWVGQGIDREAVEQVRRLWAGEFPAQGGVTRLERGLLCRYRGRSTAEARAWFQLVWGLVRSWRGADRPVAPRVWP